MKFKKFNLFLVALFSVLSVFSFMAIGVFAATNVDTSGFLSINYYAPEDSELNGSSNSAVPIFENGVTLQNINNTYSLEEVVFDEYDEHTSSGWSYMSNGSNVVTGNVATYNVDATSLLNTEVSTNSPTLLGAKKLGNTNVANIKGYVVQGSTANKYKLFVLSYGKIYANSNCSYLFDGLTNLTKVGLYNFNAPTGSSINSTTSMFNGCTNLTTLSTNKATQSGIQIPSFVTSIGDNAFSGCSSLASSITIPATVTSVGASAFQNCTSLSTITFANNSACTTIGSEAFSGCLSLTTMTLPFVGNTPSANNSKTGVLGYIFGETTDTSYPVQYYNDEMTQRFAIPTSLKTLTILGGDAKYGAFSGTKLEKVTIPNWTSILDYSFYACTSLKYFGTTANPTGRTLPSNLTSIGTCAFKGCNNSSFTSISIPSKVNIGVSAFENCSYLYSISFSGSSTEYKTIGNYAFQNCGVSASSTAALTIPSNYSSIGNYAFKGCTKISSITIQNSFMNKTIGTSAFEGCTGATYVTLGSDITTIGNSAFKGCNNSSFKSITIPNTVTNIGTNAFQNCSSLETVTYNSLPSGYTQMEYIQSSGSQYINTNFCPNQDTRVVSIWGTDSDSTDGKNVFYGGATAETPGGQPVKGIEAYLWSGVYDINYQNNSQNFGSCVYGNKILIDQNKNITNVYDMTSGIPASISNDYTSFSSDFPIYLFGLNRSGSVYSCQGAVKLYMLKIWNDGTLVRNYLPAKRNSDGVYGMYDLVNSVFYSSVTSTNFSSGSGAIISSEAFSGCSSLTTMTLPFVGGNSIASSASSSSLFGYIFGNVSGTSVTQNYSASGTASYKIPSSLRTVTINGGRILYGAFYSCSMLTSVTIPSSLTAIPDYAFYNCGGLTSINLPSSLTSIGNYAFAKSSYSSTSGSTGLSGTLTIPQRVQTIGTNAFENTYISTLTFNSSTGTLATNRTIGNYAFNNCQNLGTITLSANKNITTIGDYAFKGCNKISLSSITIPTSVTSVGMGAFQNCSNVSTVTFTTGSSCTSIGSAAFSGCSSLATMTLPFVGNTKTGTTNTNLGYIFGVTNSSIPASLKTIELIGGETLYSNSFTNCSNLTSVSVSKYTTKIERSAFQGCSSLYSITLPFIGVRIGATGAERFFSYIFSYGYENVPSTLRYVTICAKDSDSIAIPDSSFDANNVTNFTVSSNSAMISVGDMAFLTQTSLTSVNFNSKVNSIGDGAFYGCTGLHSINLTGVTSIGENAFYGSGLNTALTIPNTVTDIGTSSFKNTSITSLTFSTGGSTKTIGTSAFSGCTSLATVTFNSRVTQIGETAFYGCSSLHSINLSGVTSIGTGAFRDSGLNTALTIPNTVTTIGERSFQSTGITSLTLSTGGSPKAIGNIAFSGCTSLATVTFNSCATSLGGSAFNGCSALHSINLTGVTSIGDSAFKDSGLNTALTIPNTVTSVGNYSFQNTGITSLTLSTGGSTKSIGTSAFSGCTSLATVTFNSRATSLGGSAFNGCSALHSIDLTGVTSIGDSAFYGSGLNSALTIPGTVNSIGSNAFKSTSITSLTYNAGSSSQSIGQLAFNSCSSLTTVYLYNTSSVSIGSDAFTNATNLKNVYISSSSLANSITTISGQGNIVRYAYDDNKEIYLKSSINPSSSSIFYNLNVLKTTTQNSISFKGYRRKKVTLSKTMKDGYACNITYGEYYNANNSRPANAFDVSNGDIENRITDHIYFHLQANRSLSLSGQKYITVTITSSIELQSNGYLKEGSTSNPGSHGINYSNNGYTAEIYLEAKYGSGNSWKQVYLNFHGDVTITVSCK